MLMVIRNTETKSTCTKMGRTLCLRASLIGVGRMSSLSKFGALTNS